MTKPITRVCCDCGGRLKNRSASTKRCRVCYLVVRNASAKGRTLPSCNGCQKVLTTKNNATGHCKECSKLLPRKPRGKNAVPAWNKGKSIYANEAERKAAINASRKALRLSRTAEHHLADRIRTLIRNSLRRASANKASKTAVLLGCSTNDFKSYLEARFSDEMSWENYGNGKGQWNIDHITPISLFDLVDIAQQKAAFHYTNCQPLWAVDNFKKGNRI
jgi:hypothetical protein